MNTQPDSYNTKDDPFSDFVLKKTFKNMERDKLLDGIKNMARAGGYGDYPSALG